MLFFLKQVQFQLYGPLLLHDEDMSLVSMTVALLGIRLFCRRGNKGHLVIKEPGTQKLGR